MKSPEKGFFLLCYCKMSAIGLAMALDDTIKNYLFDLATLGLLPSLQKKLSHLSETERSSALLARSETGQTLLFSTIQQLLSAEKDAVSPAARKLYDGLKETVYFLIDQGAELGASVIENPSAHHYQGVERTFWDYEYTVCQMTDDSYKSQALLSEEKPTVIPLNPQATTPKSNKKVYKIKQRQYSDKEARDEAYKYIHNPNDLLLASVSFDCFYGAKPNFVEKALTTHNQFKIKANVNACFDCINYKTTALHIAIKNFIRLKRQGSSYRSKNMYRVIDTLLKNGADVMAKESYYNEPYEKTPIDLVQEAFDNVHDIALSDLIYRMQSITNKSQKSSEAYNPQAS